MVATTDENWPCCPLLYVVGVCPYPSQVRHLRNRGMVITKLKSRSWLIPKTLPPSGRRWRGGELPRGARPRKLLRIPPGGSLARTEGTERERSPWGGPLGVRTGSGQERTSSGCEYGELES